MVPNTRFTSDTLIYAQGSGFTDVSMTDLNTAVTVLLMERRCSNTQLLNVKHDGVKNEEMD